MDVPFTKDLGQFLDYNLTETSPSSRKQKTSIVYAQMNLHEFSSEDIDQ